MRHLTGLIGATDHLHHLLFLLLHLVGSLALAIFSKMVD